MPRLTALHQAVEQGDLEEVQRLLEAGADVNVVFADRWQHPSKHPSIFPSSIFLCNITPLHIAARLGHFEIAHLLLRYGAHPNGYRQHSIIARVPPRIRLLLPLIGTFMVSFVLFLKGVGMSGYIAVDIFTLSGFFSVAVFISLFVGAGLGGTLSWETREWNDPPTPLHLAIEFEHRNIVELLLNYNADINATESEDPPETPFTMAAITGNAAIAKLLLERGASPNNNSVSRYRWLRAVLHWFFRGRTTRKILLDGWGSYYFWRKLGKTFFPPTPLHEAARYGHAEIVMLLLDYKSDPHAVTLEINSLEGILNLMPIHYALSFKRRFYIYDDGMRDPVKRVAKIGIAKVLLTKLQNPPISLLNELLHLAAAFGAPDIVKQLIDLGAQVNNRTFGTTPLYSVFLEDANRASKWPGELAQAKLETLKVLIASGANVNAMGNIFADDITHHTRPLHCAISLRWFEAVETLLASGAKFRGKALGIFTNHELADTLNEYFHGKDAEKKAIRKILKLLVTKSDDSLSPIHESHFTMAKNTNDIKLMKIIYPYEICRNLGEENLLQARVKAAFKHLIHQGWISEYQYEWILKCEHPLVKNYLHILGAQLLAAVKEIEKVPSLKKLTMDCILQNLERFSKQDLKKLTLDLKAELKEANTSMPLLTLSYPITSKQSSWQELRAKHRQRQQNNPYDDEPINANDDKESEIKIKVL